MAMKAILLFLELSVLLTVLNSLMVQAQKCDDVAIIGAGMGGSYTAWKLRDKGLKVTLYEYTNRIGGRIHTAHFDSAPSVNLEMGAMRYSPEIHVRLAQAIEDLGLDTKVFQFAAYDPPDLFYTRGSWMRKDEIVEKAPYALRERLSVPEIQWRVITEHTNFRPGRDQDSLELRRRLRSEDGVKLSDQWLSTFYSKYTTMEEYQYMTDLQQFDDIQQIPADMYANIKDPSEKASETVRTVTKGFQAIPETMLDEFVKYSSNNVLQFNRKLVKMKKRKSGSYSLFFVDPRSGKSRRECANKVILASSLPALQYLDFQPFNSGELRDIIQNAMLPQVAWKIFLGYNRQWWKKSEAPTGDYTVSNTPLGNSFIFGRENKYNVLLATYYDRIVQLSKWQDVFKQGSPFPSPDESLQITDVTVNLVRQYLAEIYNLTIDDVPQPDQAVGRIWEDEIIGGAWFYFAPGYNTTYLNNKMIKPSDNDEVYIANSIYNNEFYNYWSEAALQNAESVLNLLGY